MSNARRKQKVRATRESMSGKHASSNASVRPAAGPLRILNEKGAPRDSSGRVRRFAVRALSRTRWAPKRSVRVSARPLTPYEGRSVRRLYWRSTE